MRVPNEGEGMESEKTSCVRVKLRGFVSYFKDKVLGIDAEQKG